MRYARSALLLALLVLPGLPAVRAEEDPEPPARIRILYWHTSENDRITEQGLLRGLRIAGIDGDVSRFNAEFDPSVATDDAGRDREQLRAERAARERLRRWKTEGDVDLLVAMGTHAAIIAMDEYRDIPVVFTAVTHPGAAGITRKTGFGPTGRNLTGNSSWIGMDRVLALFRRAVPRLRKLGVVASDRNAVSEAEIGEALRTIREGELPLELVVRFVTTTEDLRRTASTLAGEVDAIWIPIDDLCYRNVPILREAVRPSGIPLLSSSRQAVTAGARVGLTCDYELLGIQAAGIVRRVLVEKRDPGTLPILRLKTFELIVNLDAGGRVPPEIVASADRILSGKSDR